VGVATTGAQHSDPTHEMRMRKEKACDSGVEILHHSPGQREDPQEKEHQTPDTRQAGRQVRRRLRRGKLWKIYKVDHRSARVKVKSFPFFMNVRQSGRGAEMR